MMNSIKNRLMLWLMVWVTVIVGGTGFVSYLNQKVNDESDYQAARNALQTRLRMALPYSVWQLDDEHVRLTLDSELSWRAAAAIRVKGDSGLNIGRSRDASGNLRDLTPTEVPTTDDTLDIPIVYLGKEHLGTASVYLSRATLEDKQRADLMIIVLQVLILDGLLFFIMSFNLQRFVFHPLKRLQQALDTAILQPDASGAQIKHVSDDEIGAVVSGFNRIVERTAQDLVKRAEAETCARLERDKAEEALRQLKDAQQTLVESEKMASLGSLVAGVAHEINTPVGITLTTASHLGSATGHIMEKLNAGNVKKSDFQSYLETARECSNLILSNADRAANLIHSFKQVAVDQTSEARRDFLLGDYLNEIITSLKPRFKHSGIEIDVQCEGDVLLDSYPGALSQVVTNLVMNAQIHAFENRSSGIIRILAKREENNIISLTLSDDGKGIAPEHMGRIFEPFFTTRRSSGGSGLGLNIVYNIVRQKLGGRIEVHSEPGCGTTFLIHLPCVAPEIIAREYSL